MRVISFLFCAHKLVCVQKDWYTEHIRMVVYMNLSPSEMEQRRTEIKRLWAPHSLNRNQYATDQLDAMICGGCAADALRSAIEHHKTATPELNIGYDDLIKSAIGFGNLQAVAVLWGCLSPSQREKITFTGDNWGLAVHYRQDHIVQYFLTNHRIPEYSSAHALKDLAPWASLNTIKLAAEKYKHLPSMCASALLEACSNPREDVMIFLAQLSGLDALKKMQYGVANPQIAQLFEDSQNIEKVQVFNTFVQKMILTHEVKSSQIENIASATARKI